VAQEKHFVWNSRSGTFDPNDGRRASLHFIRGPIPSNWIQTAAKLPGAALPVALATWEVAGLSGRQQGLVVSSERLARYGVSRYSKRRALAALVSAGLIRVHARKNRSPQIDVLFPIGPDGDSSS
jgi:hypothetical protein